MSDIKFISLIFQLVAGLMPLAVLFFGNRKFSFEFTLYLTLSIISTFVILITNYFKIQNAIVFDGFQISSIILLSLFYFRNIQSKMLSNVVIILGLFSLLSYSIELICLGYPQKSLVIENVSFIIGPILFYIDSIVSNQTSSTLVLVNTSIFFYKSFSFLLFYFLVTLMVSNFWHIHNFIEGSSKLLIAYALWKLPKTAHS